MVSLALTTLVLGLARFDITATNDGPHHLAAAVVAHRYGDVASRARECFVLNTPLTARGAHELLRAALWVFEPLTASRVVGCMVAVVVAVSAAAFVTSARRRVDAWALLAVALAFNTGLVLGLLTFLLGSSLALFAGALWLHPRVRPAIAAAGVAALGFGAATCHVVGAGAVFAGLCVVTLVHERKRLPLLLAALTPTALLALLASRASVGGDWSFTLASLREVLVSAVPLPPVFGAVLLGVVLVGAGAGCARSERRAAAFVALGFLALTMTLPLHLGAWHYGGRRLILAACVFAMAAAPERGARSPIAIALAGVFTLALSFCFLRASAAAAAITGDVVRQIRQAHPAPLLRVGAQHTDARSFAFEGAAAPLMDFTALVAVLHGGASLTGHHARAGIHTVLLRCGPRVMPPGVQVNATFSARPLRAGDPYTAHMLTLASLVEGIAVLGTQADMNYLEGQAGFVTEHRGTSLYLGRRPACALDVELQNVTRPTVIEFGYVPLREPARGFVVPPGGRGGRIGGLPCGPMWMRLSPGLRCVVPAVQRFTTTPEAPLARVVCSVTP